MLIAVDERGSIGAAEAGQWLHGGLLDHATKNSPWVRRTVPRARRSESASARWAERVRRDRTRAQSSLGTCWPVWSTPTPRKEGWVVNGSVPIKGIRWFRVSRMRRPMPIAVAGR